MNEKTEVTATSNLNAGAVAATASTNGSVLGANSQETAHTLPRCCC